VCAVSTALVHSFLSKSAQLARYSTNNIYSEAVSRELSFIRLRPSSWC